MPGNVPIPLPAANGPINTSDGICSPRLVVETDLIEQDIHRSTVPVMGNTQTVEQMAQDVQLQTEEQIREALHVLAAQGGGSSRILAIAADEFGKGKGRMDPPLRSTVATEVPAQLIAACKEHLRGWEEGQTWTFDVVCGLLKRSIEYKQSFEETQPEARVTEDRVEYLRTADHSIEASPRKGRLVAPSGRREAQTKPSSLLELGPSDDSIEGGRTQLTSKIKALQLDHSDVSARLESSLQQNENLQAIILEQKIGFLRNHQFDTQLDDNIIVTFAQDVRPQLPATTWVFMKLKPPTRAIIVADYYHEFPLRPRIHDATIYLEILIGCTLINPGKLDDVSRAQHFAESHLPWLLAMLPELLNQGNQHIFRLLHSYVGTIINSPSLRPQGFTLSLLFVLVAYLAKRFDLVRDTTLWLDLELLIFDGNYGSPEAKWDVLNHITFAWFLSVGSTNTRLAPSLNSKQSQDISLLVAALRGVYIFDFIGFLQHPAVILFIEKDNDSELFCAANGTNHIAILRTTSPSHKPLSYEYIWVRLDDQVLFYEGGLEFRLEDIGGNPTLTMRPIGGSDLPWFPTDKSNLEDYLDKYYSATAEVEKSRQIISNAIPKIFPSTAESPFVQESSAIKEPRVRQKSFVSQTLSKQQQSSVPNKSSFPQKSSAIQHSLPPRESSDIQELYTEDNDSASPHNVDEAISTRKRSISSNLAQAKAKRTKTSAHLLASEDASLHRHSDEATTNTSGDLPASEDAPLHRHVYEASTDTSGDLPASEDIALHRHNNEGSTDISKASPASEDTSFHRHSDEATADTSSNAVSRRWYEIAVGPQARPKFSVYLPTPMRESPIPAEIQALILERDGKARRHRKKSYKQAEGSIKCWMSVNYPLDDVEASGVPGSGECAMCIMRRERELPTCCFYFTTTTKLKLFN